MWNVIFQQKKNHHFGEIKKMKKKKKKNYHVIYQSFEEYECNTHT